MKISIHKFNLDVNTKNVIKICKDNTQPILPFAKNKEIKN